MSKALGITVILLSCIRLLAQDYAWWNEKHNYDGVTHWRDYIQLSAAFMGPNALPVPDLRKGELDSLGSFQNSVFYHYSPGDRTYNWNSFLQLPLYSDKIALQAEIVPLEYFEMDTITRDLRRVRNRSGAGYAAGDVYLRTLVQLIKNQSHWPDVLLTIQLKTASGTNLSSARFTDTPGYCFDLSFGKSYARSNGIWRIHGQGGFYVYQLFGDGNQQNDAIHYGLGITWKNSLWQVENHLAGYYGYFGNGDRPLVNRIYVSRNFQKHWAITLHLQSGWVDFPYQSIALGLKKKFDYRLYDKSSN